MTNLFSRKWRYLKLLTVFKLLKSLKNIVLVLFLPTYSFAIGNLPFNTALDEFKASFISATFDIAIILMMATCLMLAFGEWSDGIKRFINIVFFISLALAAPTGIVLLFGTGGY